MVETNPTKEYTSSYVIVTLGVVVFLINIELVSITVELLDKYISSYAVPSGSIFLSKHPSTVKLDTCVPLCTPSGCVIVNCGINLIGHGVDCS